LDQYGSAKFGRKKPRRLTRDREIDRFQFVREQRADVDPQRQVMSREVHSRIQEILGSSRSGGVVFEMRHYQGMRLAIDRDGVRRYRGSREKLSFRAIAGRCGRARGFCMTCHDAQANLSLYLYGELRFCI